MYACRCEDVCVCVCACACACECMLGECHLHHCHSCQDCVYASEFVRTPATVRPCHHALLLKAPACRHACAAVRARAQVSWGSFHAITDMMPALSRRYPYMCFRFFADLDLMPLGAQCDTRTHTHSHTLARTHTQHAHAHARKHAHALHSCRPAACLTHARRIHVFPLPDLDSMTLG